MGPRGAHPLRRAFEPPPRHSKPTRQKGGSCRHGIARAHSRAASRHRLTAPLSAEDPCPGSSSSPARAIESPQLALEDARISPASSTSRASVARLLASASESEEVAPTLECEGPPRRARDPRGERADRATRFPGAGRRRGTRTTALRIASASTPKSEQDPRRDPLVLADGARAARARCRCSCLAE